MAWSCFALVACGDDSNPGTTAAGATGMGGAGGASSSSSASSGGGGMGGAGLLCGNGVVDAPETCDDGNHASGDGCSAFCIEEGPIVDLQANADRSCVIGQGGTLRCWGHGEIGELGYPGIPIVGDDETPASVGDVNVGAPVRRIAFDRVRTCAVLYGGHVRCWGFGFYTDDIGDNEPPAAATDIELGASAIDIAVANSHYCALLEAGTVRCWGSAGSSGKLGYGNSVGCNGCNDGPTCCVGDDEMPGAAGDVDIGGKAIQIAAGEFHTCVLLEGGGVRCWGLGLYGRLGYGTFDVGDDETPASMGDVDIGGKAIQITAGLDHTCALLAGGTVRCWGSNTNGRLGYGNPGMTNLGDNEPPSSAGDVNVGGIVTQIISGGEHTCALLSTGAVRCWGSNQYHQLGYADPNPVGDDETPAMAGDVDIGGPAVEVATGDKHTCALLQNGQVRCWGYGGYGALGYGTAGVQCGFVCTTSPTCCVSDDETPASAGDVPLF